MTKKYKIKYRVEPGEFKKSSLTKKDGACDQILLCSYVEGSDGSGSYLWISSDGNPTHQEMIWGRKMNCWLSLTKSLAEGAPDDCPNQKAILEEVFELFREAKASFRKDGA